MKIGFWLDQSALLKPPGFAYSVGRILRRDVIKQHLDWLIVVLISLSIVMYDLTIGLVFNLLHFIFAIIHTGYEWLELGIEHSVEHLFHTSRHGSQIVTFYILLLLAVCLLHWLWKLLPTLYRHIRLFVQLAWERRKMEWEAYWLSLTLINKLKLFSTATGIIYLGFFFVM